MKVKMITALTTNKMNLSFGDVVLVDKDFGKQLVASNMAVLVEDVKEPKIEVEKPKRTRKKKVD